MKNEIYLNKKFKILVPLNRIHTNDSVDKTRIMAVTMARNIEDLGFILSPKLINEIALLPESGIISLYEEVVPILKKMKGAHVNHKPMYPNFPQSVIDMSEVALYLNALVHYLSDGQWKPTEEVKERFPLFENTKMIPINLGIEDDFKSIFTDLLASKSSISQSDKDVLVKFFEIYPTLTLVNLLPEKIHMKEQLGFIFAQFVKTKVSPENLTKLVKQPTDVLRIAVALSDGDVSLATNTKFKKLSRGERRLLLALLESCSGLAENMLKYREQWIRLGEKLHPGEYKKAYPKTFNAFQLLRNEPEKVETFNRELETYLIHDPASAVALLTERPGVFARRLDHVLRLLPEKRENIAKQFLNTAHEVSTPVLLQMHSHFRSRNHLENRVVMPKGNITKLQTIPALPAMPEKFCSKMVEHIETVLKRKFKELPTLGKVWIDPSLKNYLVPFSERTASKALKTIVRGSRVNLDPNLDTVRFFIWWKNGTARTDIDLSAVVLNDKFELIDTISYYNLKTFGGHHSGDIVDAPKGASEFIDISMKKVLQYKNLAGNGRYVAMVINSFTMQPYCDLPECFAGFMGRQAPNSGEIYEPKTVANKFDLTANTRMALPLIIDCKEKQVVWMDLSATKFNWHRGGNNVASNKTTISDSCKAIVNLEKFNIFDLLRLHAETRGTLVSSKDQADVVFDVDFASNFSEILTKYL